MSGNKNNGIGWRDAIVLSLAAQNRRQEDWVRKLTPDFRKTSERSALNADGWSIISNESQASR